MEIVLDTSLRRKSLDIASSVVTRLQDVESALDIARLASTQSTVPGRQWWDPLSATYRLGPLALLFGQMDRCFPDQGWEQIAHTYLTRAVRALEQTPDLIYSPGLFGGLSGMCFTTFLLSHNGMRYQRLLRRLDDLLVQRVAAFFRLSDPAPAGVAFADYDLISGPSGIGAYLLLRKDVPEAISTLGMLLDRLISLSEYQDGQLRFFIPPERQATERHREQYPQGSIDCGLAHGVPGPLALLALAYSAGIERPGLLAALQRLSRWVMEQSYRDAWGLNWPYAVPPTRRNVEDASYVPHPTRAAWCYGSPGVARALWLAGVALHEDELQQTAIAAMEAIQRRPVEARGIDSPILCHGVAGLLQITLRFASDTGQPFLAEMATELTQQLLGLFDADTPVGFRNTEPEGMLVDDPGLLEGAAGVALALLTAATGAEPAWDRMFLLS